MLKGAPVSAGIGIGKALIVQQDEVVVVRRAVTNQETEKKRFTDAAEQFCDELQIVSEIVSRNIGTEEADIIDVQSAIVQNAELVQEIFEKIENSHVNVEYAVDMVLESYVKAFESLEDELFRARAADVRDVKIRLLRILTGTNKVNLQNIPENSILVAEDIAPSQALVLDHSKISAIVTQMGTRFSHIAIIARALQIPTVVAVENACNTLREGDHLIVDGECGDIYRNPSQEKLIQYHERREEARRFYQILSEYRDKKTYTADEKRIGLSANLAMPQELAGIAENQVDGIGLFRTEYLYMNSHLLPGEQTQFESYRSVLQAMCGKPVVIRTLDAGGDKWISYLGQKREENPFLGQRGIRFCLSHQELFKTQISALLRSSVYGNLKILLPLISTITELRDAKRLIREVKDKLSAKGIPFDDQVPLGIMIETPSAALCADILAREVDFFSLGSNDLTQYTLAVDRNNETVADLYSPLHPSVLRLMKFAVDGAHGAGISVEVCGEIPSEMQLIPLLIGMGVDGFSVSSSSVLQVRQRIAQVDSGFWSDQIARILHLATPAEVKAYIHEKSLHDETVKATAG